MPWETFEQLVRERRHDELTPLLLALSAEDRKAFVAPLKALVRVPAGEWFPFEQEAGVALIGAAVLPNASALAPWLRRHRRSYATGEVRRVEHYGHTQDIHVIRDLTDEVMTVLVARDVPWLGDLAHRMAARLPTARVDREAFELVERLLDHTGAAPPDSEGFLVGVLIAGGGRPGIVARAERDPRYAALVPRLPDVDLAGGSMAAGWGSTLAAEVAGLAARGVVDRVALLDATIGRLQRGGKPFALKGFAHLYEQLTPSTDELLDRVRDLVALTDDTPPFVVQVVQRQLYELDDLGLLTSADRSEVTANLLRRSEKGIVRAALGRCRQVVAADPAAAGVVAVDVTAAFALAAVDLQRDAVRFVGDVAVGLDVDQRAAVLAAAVDLPADLRRDLTAALGDGAAVPVDDAVPVGRLVRSEPVPFSPVASPGDLVASVVGLPSGAGADPIAVEQILEGLVRFGTVPDGHDLRAVFRPVLEGISYRWASRTVDHPYVTYSETRDSSLPYAVLRVLAAAVGGPTWPRWPAEPFEAPLQTALIDRIEQIAVDLEHRRGPLLVGFPSDSTGSLHPADLLSRLRAAAQAGPEPWPGDLSAALLRLDRTSVTEGCGPEAFAELGTEAGRTVAAALRSEAPRADVAAVAVDRDIPRSWWVTYSAPGQLDTGPSEPPTDPESTVLPVVRPAPGSDPVFAALVGLEIAPHGAAWRHRMSHAPLACWSAMLPWHRDVVAAHGVEGFRSSLNGSNVAAVDLVQLAGAGGRCGDGMALLLAYTLGAKAVGTRGSAVDAMLVLAARDDLDGARLGDFLALLIGRGEVVTARVTGPLRDAALSGAAVPVWATLSALIAGLLAATRVSPKLADVVALAAEVVVLPDVRPVAAPAGLAAFAARKGSSRSLVEARRLCDLIADTTAR